MQDLTIKERIKQQAKSIYNEILESRKYLHSIPELSFKEFQTADYICSVLDRYKIPYRKAVAKTGVVALLEFRDPGSKVIALRADMDALPVNEENNVDYRSKHQGVMHACGHDVHMACLLGAAKILSGLGDELTGTVKLIFQPSEESYPGGASVMINEGVLQDPSPGSILAQHVYPQLECGKVGVRSGKYMASTDEIYLTVKGKGGHAAMPHLVIDPVVIASHIVVAIQQIVSRKASPWTPSVLSFGRIMGEGRMNVIPETVTLDGTIRTFDEPWRAQVHKELRKMACGIAESMGGSCNVRIEKGYPYLVNDEALCDNFKKYAVDYLGEENVVDLDLSMTAEDFAYYSQKIPACFYRLGVRNEEQGITSNLHSSTFNIDEKALETGAGLMAWVAVNELAGNYSEDGCG